MITTKPNDDYQYVHTVYTNSGALRIGESMWAKARLWILEDRSIMAIVPGQNGADVERIPLGTVEEAVRVRGEVTITLTDSDEPIRFRERTCGSCGMGAVGSAGPVEGKWRMERVRLPEWMKES